MGEGTENVKRAGGTIRRQTATVHSTKKFNSDGLGGCGEGVESAKYDGAVPMEEMKSNIQLALADISRGGRKIVIKKKVSPTLPNGLSKGSRVFLVFGTKNRQICPSFTLTEEGKVLKLGTPAKVENNPVFSIPNLPEKYAAMAIKDTKSATSSDGKTTVTYIYFEDSNGQKVVNYLEQDNLTLPKFGFYMADNNWNILREDGTPCAIDDTVVDKDKKPIGKIKSGEKPKECNTDNKCEIKNLTAAKTWYGVGLNVKTTEKNDDLFKLPNILAEDPKKCLETPFKYSEKDKAKIEVADPKGSAQPVSCGKFPSCEIQSSSKGSQEGGVISLDGGVDSNGALPIKFSVRFFDSSGNTIKYADGTAAEQKDQDLLPLTSTTGVKIEIPLSGAGTVKGEAEINVEMDTTGLEPNALYGIILDSVLVVTR